jgi:hypothetical protein
VMSPLSQVAAILEVLSFGRPAILRATFSNIQGPTRDVRALDSNIFTISAVPQEKARVRLSFRSASNVVAETVFAEARAIPLQSATRAERRVLSCEELSGDVHAHPCSFALRKRVLCGVKAGLQGGETTEAASFETASAHEDQR